MFLTYFAHLYSESCIENNPVITVFSTNNRLSDKLKIQLPQDYFQYNFQDIGGQSKLRTYGWLVKNDGRIQGPGLRQTDV